MLRIISSPKLNIRAALWQRLYFKYFVATTRNFTKCRDYACPEIIMRMYEKYVYVSFRPIH